MNPYKSTLNPHESPQAIEGQFTADELIARRLLLPPLRIRCSEVTSAR